MGRINLITYLVVIFVFGQFSCSKDDQSQKYCEKGKLKAQAEIQRGNISPSFKTKLLISKFEQYFIWKKYGIHVDYQLFSFSYDSCYNEIMLSNTPNLNDIIKDLDSLVSRKIDYSSFQTFHDGIFLIYPDDEDENFYPHRIDINYYSKRKQFTDTFTPYLSDTVKCKFWYEIDTLGNVSNIEIYHHASKEIDSLVIEFYKSFQYNPANNGQKRVMFRDKDQIVFFGTLKE